MWAATDSLCQHRILDHLDCRGVHELAVDLVDVRDVHGGVGVPVRPPNKTTAPLLKL